MLEIPKIYSNFATNVRNFFVSRWVPETSKVLWYIPSISLHSKHDDVPVSWTH